MAEPMQSTYLGQATGPTAEMLQATPWMTGGFLLLIFGFLLYFGFAILAARHRLPGRWLTLSGLVIIFIIFLYFIFQNTVANDAELRYGPTANAVSLVLYGIGGFFVAIGYARSILHARGRVDVR